MFSVKARDMFDKNINIVQTIAILVAIGFSAHQLSENTRSIQQQEYGSLIQQQQEIFAMQIDSGETYKKSYSTHTISLLLSFGKLLK